MYLSSASSPLTETRRVGWIAHDAPRVSLRPSVLVHHSHHFLVQHPCVIRISTVTVGGASASHLCHQPSSRCQRLFPSCEYELLSIRYPV